MIEKNDLSFGTDKIISVASMYYKEDTSNSDDDYMRTYNVMRLGDIAFEGNKSKNFAHGRFVENTIGDGIVSHVFDVFRPISEYDLLFWKYFINYEGVMGRIMIRCTKSSTMMTNLVAKDFLEESIVVPSIVEQKRIGYYLKSIDHLITLHQSKSFGHILKAIVSCTLSWEQRKLGEYLIQYTEVTIINDQYPVLTSSRKGIFFQKDYYDGNQIASENNIGYNIVPYGYFTYRHMSDDEIFYFNINNIIDNGIVSTLYPVFTTNNRLDSKFLQYELNFGKEFRKYSVLQKQGGSRTYMYFNKLRDLKLTITTSLKEQECIRNLICSIDHLITLHQRKLEKLKIIKKSMLENLFPQNEEKTPKIRFLGFTKDWEQRKFSEIVLRESNFRLSSPDLPCVEYEDVVSEAGILNNDIRSKKVVKAGIVFYDTHVLYGKLRPYLHNWLCPDFSGVAVGDWWVLKPCYVVREFIYRIIQTKRFDNATNQSSGSKMPRADWNLVSNTEFMIPSDSSEQEKIGLYFKKIDHLITLHQSKLEKLQKIKKSMLESMFV